MRTEIIATKGSTQWQGIPAIERAPDGRLWCAFFSGGAREPHADNRILLTTSADDGASWSGPEVIVAPPGATRAYDPALWHDPNGRLWLIYNQANLEKQEFSLWVMTAEDSGAAQPHWSPARRIELGLPFAFCLNKPTVLSTGAWVLPVTWSTSAPDGWFAGANQLQGVAISTDSGANWSFHGAVGAPGWVLEHMIVERGDGRLWMLIRTGDGVLGQSFSVNRGRSWGAASATAIVNPGSRFFIRRLASGRLLLINTPDPELRQRLVAYLSDPDGGDEVFGGGLELDERDKVSYPDAVQAPNGTIYAVHDRERYGPGEIILDVFTEDEILSAGE